jgi:exonuclease SbcC
MNVEGKEVEIYRVLKRTSSSVVQDAGYIVIDGIKKDGTAIELKQAVIELLNYPQDFLTKSKSLVYRYTVYTPQEDMKMILLGNKEDRLETLRRVFGIDKYKRVASNAKIVVGNLKDKSKELKGRLADLDEKRALKVERENVFIECKKEFDLLKAPLDEADKKVLNCKDNIKLIEESINKARELKKEMDILDVDLKNKINRKSSLSLEINSLVLEIEKLSLEKLDVDMNIKDKLETKKMEIDAIEKELRFFRDKLQELKTRKSLSESVRNKINELNNCPTCYQIVSEEHKCKVVERESEKIKIIENDANGFNSKIEDNEIKLKLLKQEFDYLNKELHNLELIKLKKSSLNDKLQKLDYFKAEEMDIKKNIGEINLKRNDLFEKWESMKGSENIYEEVKRKLDDAQLKKKEIEMRLVGVESRMNSLKEVIDGLKVEINKKLEDKSKLDYVGRMLHWLDEQFINMMLTMEKNIMLKVHSDFNALFEKWFSIMVNSEVINVKLDDSFSPLVEQNGYEIDYEYLSGGEKTAAALAYRLSLNQVINNIMSTINTKDLVILDEPTDGFSNEQLDRLRILFDELDVSQLIIVSHEPKIETFVDNIIRFNKNEHVSQVI